MAKLREMLDQRLAAILEPLGFRRYQGPWVTFIREDQGRKVFVAATHAPYIKGFDVSLQEIGPDGTRRATTLEEYGGVETFSYAGRELDAVEDAVRMLREYGLPWMDGVTVQSPALIARADVAKRNRYESLTERAKMAFRSGDFSTAVGLYEEAAQLYPLDKVSAKYSELARKRGAS